MPRVSAGLLLYRRAPTGGVEVLLVHPGGPFWARKDAGAWSIPKGEYDEDDDPAARAEEEFAEELGQRAPPGPRLDLGEVRQAGGKRVRAWAVRGDIDARATTSNTFEMEWPPRSGEQRTLPRGRQGGVVLLGRGPHQAAGRTAPPARAPRVDATATGGDRPRRVLTPDVPSGDAAVDAQDLSRS